MNRIKLLIVGVASMGIASFAAAADEATQTPPCLQPPAQMECPMMSGPQDGSGCMMMPPPMMGPRHGMKERRGCGPMGAGGFMAGLPKEIKDRMDALRADREALADLWTKAVLARGDKPVEALREEFAKANADLIAKIEKSGNAIHEDMQALREGYDKDGRNCPMMEGDTGPRTNFGIIQEGGVPRGMEDFVGRLDAEIVAEIQALKKPLTVEEFAAIRGKVIKKHGKNLDKAFGCLPMQDTPYGMHGMMPPMDPALSRMRSEMRGMRGEKLEARKELRGQLREAMKIKDQAKREAAVKKILDEMADDNGDKTDDPHGDKQ